MINHDRLYAICKQNTVSVTSAFSALIKGSGGLKVGVSASQPRDHGFEHNTSHDHDFSYGTSDGWFHEAVMRVI